MRYANRLLIDGRLGEAANGKSLTTYNPATGEAICDVAEAAAEDVKQAVRAARRAFDEGPWRRLDASERGKRVRRVADLIRTRQSELAQLDSKDCGKPLKDSMEVDVPVAAEFFEYFGGLSDKICGQTIPVSNDFLNYTLREPLGVVGQITAWNFPILNAAIKLAPALACGNTVVLKPSEWTPLSAIELGLICLEADIPPGVVNVVPGYGETAGEALVRDPLVNKIAFTGSSETGKRVMALAAETLKPVTLELGGKSPNVVFADADLEPAVAGALWGAFLNQGQVCCAGTRLFLEQAIYEEFMERLLDRARALKVGDPTERDTKLGAIISGEQLAKIERYVKLGLEEGAKLLVGGAQPKLSGPLAHGFFYQPTVFTEVDNRMRLAQEEIFGPVLSVLRFNDEGDVLTLANQVMYGLAAAVWTNDLRRAHRLARQLQAGVIWVNTTTHFSWAAPYGGMKASGFGREMGLDAVQIYTHVKNVWVNLSHAPNPWAN